MLIGLHGQKYSGKSTVARQILKLYPEIEWEQLAFADPVKDMACILLGVDRSTLDYLKNLETAAWFQIEYFNPEDGKVIHPPFSGKFSRSYTTIREFLTLLGTEAAQGILGPDVWVDKVLPIPRVDLQGEYLSHNFHHNKHILVTDVRFPQEIDRIKKLGGEIWGIQGINEPDEKPHLSEMTYFDQCSELIDNTNHFDGFYHLNNHLRRLLNLRLALREHATPVSTD